MTSVGRQCAMENLRVRRATPRGGGDGAFAAAPATATVKAPDVAGPGTP